MNSYSRRLIGIGVLFLSVCILSSSKFLSRKLIVNKSKLQSFLRINDSNFSNASNSSTDCREPTLDSFPDDFFTIKEKKDGGIIIHCLITLYAFAAIAVVCDEYFVMSLNRIIRDLKLSDDLAGATFMAAGSSAPELFTSIVGVIFAQSDVGTGTIVGSAVFNILFIVAICALAAKETLNIDWYPLTRDSLWYIIVIAALLGILNDGVVKWYEATILLSLYIIYIAFMSFNSRIELSIKTNLSRYNYRKSESLYLLDSPLERPRSVTTDDDDDDEIPANPFRKPEKIYQKIIWIVLFPINILFFFTVPDCRRSTFSRFPFYFLTFIISTVYMGVFTYILVWMVVVISSLLEIPDTVAGLTILAAGTSIPEVISGIIVTRKGRGAMAISNSIGSNVFDILICLGLPWFLETVIINTNSSVKIYSGGIFYSTAILLSTVLMLVLSFIINKWKLNKKLGLILMILWIIVTVVTCLFELNVFGEFTLPLCE